jgi:hypothetical protein
VPQSQSGRFRKEKDTLPLPDSKFGPTSNYFYCLVYFPKIRQILPFVLYESETQSLLLRDEQKSEMYANKAHGKLFGPSRMTYLPIPVDARSKAWVCGRALAGIVGLNPTGGTDARLLCLCVVR